MLRKFICAVALLVTVSPARAAARYDAIVYRATSEGVIAAVEAARHGLRVLVIEPEHWIGGMTAGGIGVADHGDSATITGLARVFFQNICHQYYASSSPDLADCLALQARDRLPPFHYEPHVAAAAFRAMLGAAPQAANITLKFNVDIASLQKSGNRIVSATLADGTILGAKIFIDGSYEGDLLKRADISYSVGRESNDRYHEALNGWQKPYLGKFPVDPFVTQGDPASGLLYGLQPKPEPTPRVGTADTEVMAYNYRLCLTRVPSNAVRFTTPPPFYAEARYALLVRYLNALAAHRQCDVNAQNCIHAGDVVSLGPGHVLPNDKYDINSDGPVSTDFVDGSEAYPDADQATRKEIAERHRYWEQGLLYFLQNAAAAPAGARAEFAPFGLCADEFTDTDNWPHQLYVREARRMIGTYVVTEADLDHTVPLAPDPVAIISYPHDSHVTLRFAQPVRTADGASTYALAQEGGSYLGLANPFPVPYRALVPLAGEATNLLETNALSASHSAYTAIRMEPQLMMLAQAAAAGAVLAVRNNITVQEVGVAQLEALLQAEGQVVSIPAILAVSDEGADQGGHRVVLTGQYPGVRSQYVGTDAQLADSACCWPDQTSSASTQCTPSAANFGAFSATHITLRVKYGQPGTAPYCVFHVSRIDPAVQRAIQSAYKYATLGPD
jgi:hypothetical protein